MSKRKSNFGSKVGRDSERRKTEARSYGYLNLPEKVKVYNPKPGSRARLDIMPYNVTDKRHPDRDEEYEIALVDTLWYKRPFKIHRNVGVNKETVVCPTSVGQRCPICEEQRNLMNQKADKEDIRALRASMRNLYVVVPIDDEKYDEVPHVMDISNFNFQRLLDDELEEQEDKRIFPDLEEGYTLRIRWDSKRIGDSEPFAEASRIDFKERDEAYDKSILDDVPHLDDLLNVLGYKQLEAKFYEMEPEDIDDPKENDVEHEESLPRKRKTTKRIPKEDPTVEKDENEDDTPPKRTRSRKEKNDTTENQNACPYGHEFGKDNNEYPEDCDRCEVWDDCADEFDKITTK